MFVTLLCVHILGLLDNLEVSSEPLKLPKEYSQETNLRQKIDERVTLEKAWKIYDQAGMISDVEAFRSYLAHILHRYESWLPAQQRPTRKIQRTQLQKIRSASMKLLNALDEADLAVSLDIASAIEDEWFHRTINLLGHDPTTGEFGSRKSQYFDTRTPNLEESMVSTGRVLRATQERLKELAEPEFKYTTSKDPALDRLIIDFSGTYYIGMPEDSPTLCYFDPLAEEYTGSFLDFSISILGEFYPNSYHSRAALAQRIIRLKRYWKHG